MPPNIFYLLFLSCVDVELIKAESNRDIVTASESVIMITFFSLWLSANTMWVNLITVNKSAF